MVILYYIECVQPGTRQTCQRPWMYITRVKPAGRPVGAVLSDIYLNWGRWSWNKKKKLGSGRKKKKGGGEKGLTFCCTTRGCWTTGGKVVGSYGIIVSFSFGFDFSMTLCVENIVLFFAHDCIRLNGYHRIDWSILRSFVVVSTGFRMLVTYHSSWLVV